MRSKITPAKYLAYLILITLLVYISSKAIMAYIGYSMDYKIVIGIAVIANILFYIIYLYPVSGVVLASCSLLCGVFFYINDREKLLGNGAKAGGFIYNSVVWFINYMFDIDKFNLDYARFIIIAIVILISLILFVLGTVRKHPIIILLLGVILFSTMWYFEYEPAIGYLQRYIFVSLMLFAFISYDNREVMWKIRQDMYPRGVALSWLINSVVFLLIVFIAADSLPDRIKPMNSVWLNENVFKRINDLDILNNGSGKGTANDFFNVSSVGFQEKATKLGGAAKTDSKRVLRVKVDGKVNFPLYLRGTVKDFYTGSYWDKSVSSSNIYKNDEEIDRFMEDTRSMKETDKASITVYPQGLNTRTVFNIWRPDMANVAGGSYYCYDDGEMYFAKSSGRNREYTVKSIIPLFYSDELRKSNEASKDYYGKYLQVPDKVPERVRQLTNEITKNAKNNYDKAEAIQKYLREKYPYTLNTSSVPDNRDFVDYFLFDEKKGYCTYYASAMAVMSRLAGIPSRYIEGFIVDSIDMNSSGTYDVRSSNAHAWVELYFDGYGWVRFEPTAGFSAADYERPAQETVNLTPAPGITGAIDTSGGLARRKPMDDDAGDESTGTSKKPDWGLFTVIGLAIVLLLRVGSKIVISYGAIKKADNMKGKDAAMEYFYLLEKKLKTADYKREDGETPLEFGERLYSPLCDYGIDMRDLISSFDAVRFGGVEIDIKLRNKFKNAIKKLDRFIKNKKGTFKYLMRKYLI